MSCCFTKVNAPHPFQASNTRSTGPKLEDQQDAAQRACISASTHANAGTKIMFPEASDYPTVLPCPNGHQACTMSYRASPPPRAKYAIDWPKNSKFQRRRAPAQPSRSAKDHPMTALNHLRLLSRQHVASESPRMKIGGCVMPGT